MVDLEIIWEPTLWLQTWYIILHDMRYSFEWTAAICPNLLARPVLRPEWKTDMDSARLMHLCTITRKRKSLDFGSLRNPVWPSIYRVRSLLSRCSIRLPPPGICEVMQMKPRHQVSAKKDLCFGDSATLVMVVLC